MARPRLHPTLATVAIALVTAHLWAADPDVRAREHYDRAVQHYGQREFAAALEELRRAEELRPHYRLQRALAQVHAAMRDYAAAYTANQLYLEQGGDQIAPERQQEVTLEQTKLARLVTMLSVAVDVPGATVRIDDTSVGQTPLRSPIVLNMGPHQVIVSHPNHPEQNQLITALGGNTQRLEFKLAQRPPHAPPAALSSRGEAAAGSEPHAVDAQSLRDGASPPASEELTQDETSSYLWLGWVATGALAAGATATGLWALSNDSSLADERRIAERGGAVDREPLDSRASRLRVLATVTDVLWVAAAAAGGVTLWFTLDSAGSTRRGAADPLQVQAGVSPQGLSVRGSF
jgi:hypothetical protein